MTVILRERLNALIEPLLGRLGFELVELEYASGHGRAVLRLYIDREGGVALQDCERVSREVAALLDIEDPIPRSEEHTSELQSPCNLVCRLLLEKKKNTTDQTLHSH